MEKTLMLARTAQSAAAGFVAMASLGAPAWAGADYSGFKVIDTVATAKGARTGAVDPKTGKIFLPAARYAPSAQSGGWPIMVPGSFQVLVVVR
jgi:hypothetical protein